MTHNKILTAAIAAALSIGGGIAQAAGTVENYVGASASTGMPSSTSDMGSIGVAYELFSTKTDPSPEKTLPSSGVFSLEYNFDQKDLIADDFTIEFTLTGATWEQHPTVKEAWNGASDAAKSGVEINPDAELKEVARYSVKASNTNLSKQAVFRIGGFKVKVTESDFAKSGSKVEMTVALSSDKDTNISDNQTKTLLETKAGASVAIGKGPGKSKIDVGGGGVSFIPGVNSNVLRAKLGTLNFSGTNQKNETLTATWTPTVSSATAKITNLPVLPTGSKVYLDKSGSGTAGSSCATNSTLATLSHSDNEANFGLGAFTVDEYDVCIELPTGNEKTVEPLDSAAKMFFTATYVNNDGVTDSTSGNLRHIKRNGALCKVYNVTSNTAQDITNIRITNVGSKEAVAKGTLYDMDGNVIFKNVELGTLASKQTIRKSSADLVELAKANGDCGDCEWKRGTLVVSGTFPISMMEVFALLRRKNFTGVGSFPLLNMSKGASQTACD
jgi:hypothetical protein